MERKQKTPREAEGEYQKRASGLGRKGFRGLGNGMGDGANAMQFLVAGSGLNRFSVGAK